MVYIGEISYGTHLLKTLEEQIAEKGMNSTLFKWCRQFYILYPQIGATVSNQFNLPDFGKNKIRASMKINDEILLETW